MAVSPFTYFRGAALPMASDLAATPVSGLAVQTCGDAHLSNFGIFGSAERSSAGTGCWIVLMLGRHDTDPLFLQVRGAGPSVLSRFAGASSYASQGQRVVAGQRLMQASSDIFPGWQRTDAGLDGGSRDYYVRQLRAMRPDG